MGGYRDDVDTSTVPRTSVDDELFVALVIERRRHLAVTLRWPGLETHNVVGLFPTLGAASHAARRLPVAPEAVSAVVLLPVDPTIPACVAVGVHTAHEDVAGDALASLRRSGAGRVSRFGRS